MFTVGKIKDGNLSIIGRVDERVPKFTDGLKIHYPFDYTLNGKDYNKKRNLLNIKQWRPGSSGDQGDFLAYNPMALKDPFNLEIGDVDEFFVSPSGKYIGIINEKNFSLYEVANNSATFLDSYELQGNGLKASFSHDDKFIAIIQDENPYFVLLQINDNLLSLLDGYELDVPGNDVSFSYGGNYIIVADTASRVHLLKIEENIISLTSSYILSGEVESVSFAPDDEYIAVAHTQAPYFTFMKRYKDLIFQANTFSATGEPARKTIVSPNGKYIGIMTDSSLVILKRDKNTIQHFWTEPFVNNGVSFSFSSDNRYIIIVDSLFGFKILKINENNIDNIYGYVPPISDIKNVSFINKNIHIAFNVGDKTKSLYFVEFIDPDKCNEIIYYPNHLGDIDAIWRTTVHSNNIAPIGGWVNSSGIIDPSKTYRFCLWLKMEDVTSGEVSFTIRPSNSVTPLGESEPIEDAIIVELKDDKIKKLSDKWILIVSHVRSSEYDSTEIHPETGIYDTSGKKIIDTVVDFKWTNDASQAGSEFYVHGPSEVGGKYYTYHPRIEEVDETSPTIFDLINGIEDVIFIPESYENENVAYLPNGIGLHEAKEKLIEYPFLNRGDSMDSLDIGWFTKTKNADITLTTEFSQELQPSSTTFDATPDGVYIAMTRYNSDIVYLYKRTEDSFDLVSELVLPVSGEVSYISFSPDGEYLVITNISETHGIFLLRRDGDSLELIDTFNYPGHRFEDIRFSPDGEHIVAESRYSANSRSIFLLKLEEDTLIYQHSIDFPLSVHDIAFSPDGKYVSIVTPSIGQFNVYLLKIVNNSLQIVNSVLLGIGSLFKTKFSPDGNYLAVASDNIAILKRDKDNLTLIYQNQISGQASSIEFFENGRFIITGATVSPGALTLFEKDKDSISFLKTTSTNGMVYGLIALPGGQHILSYQYFNDKPHLVLSSINYIGDMLRETNTKKIVRNSFENHYSQMISIKENSTSDEQTLHTQIDQGFETGDIITFSAYIRSNVPDKVRLSISLLNQYNSELYVAHSDYLDITNTFKQLKVTQEILQNTRRVLLTIGSISNKGEYIEVYLPQCEKSNTVTNPLVYNGTPKCKIPVKLKSPYTINIDVTPSNPNNIEKEINILSGNSSLDKIAFWKDAEENVYRIRINGDDENEFILSEDDFYQDKRNNITISVDESEASVYINGILNETKNINGPGEFIEYLDLTSNGNPGAVPGHIIHSLSIYDRSLDSDEVKELFETDVKLRIQDNGSINGKINEKSFYVPEDAYYWPLSENTLDENYVVDAVNKENLIFDKGYVWAVSERRQLFKVYENTNLFEENVGKKFKPLSFDDTFVVYKYNFHKELTNYKGNIIPLEINKRYTFCVEVFVSLDYDGDYDEFIIIDKSSSEKLKYDLSKKGSWQKLITTFISESDEDVRILLSPCYDNNKASRGYILYRNPLFVNATYEVPFHKTSLKTSKLEFNFHKEINLDWSADWSIIYWKIPKGTNRNDLTGYNVESLGMFNNTVGGGYRWWGKQIDSNNLRVNSVGNIPIDLTKYFDKLHMVSIVKNGDTIKWKFWGLNSSGYEFVENVSISNPDYFVCDDGYDFKLGGYRGVDCNTMYRNLVVLKRALDEDIIEKMFSNIFKMKDFDNIYIQGDLIEGYIL